MAKGENVFLRKDGRFEARYVKGRNPEGRIVYGFCYGKTYQEAREKADRARKQLEDSGVAEEEGGDSCSFSCFCDKWLAVTGTRIKESSYTKYRTDIENHLKPFFGHKLPWEIKPEEIDAFTRMMLEEKKLSTKTVRSTLALLRSILSYIEKRSDRKMHNLEIVYPKSQKKTIRVLDENEETVLTRFLARDMDLCKFGVYMALRTGMRIGEVCALRWRDISFKTSTIAVCHTVQRLPRKAGFPKEEEVLSGEEGPEEERKTEAAGGTKTAVVMGTPKSDSSFRTIPLMPDVADLCSRFSTENQEAFVLTGTDVCMDPRKLQRRLKKYMQECNIEEAHFHTLRHTFATRCMEAGFDAKTLSEILGHSNIGITLNQYVHPNLDVKRENMSRLKTLI